MPKRNPGGKSGKYVNGYVRGGKRYRTGFPRKVKLGMQMEVGFPKTKIVKQRYVDSVLLTSTTGSLATNIWRANSPYDPYYAVGGHQALGFDQWFNFYNHYIVLGAKATCRFTFTSGSVPIQIGILLNNSATLSATGYSGLNEQGRCKDQVLNASSAAKPTVLTKKYSAKKFHNVKDLKDNFDELGALVTTDPTATALFILFAQSQDLLSTVSCRVVIEIDYIVMYSTPKELTQS